MKQASITLPPARSSARWIPVAALAATAAVPLGAATPASSATTAPSTTVVPAVKTVADTASVPFSSCPGATVLFVR